MLSYLITALFRDTSLAYVYGTWSDGQMAINGHWKCPTAKTKTVLKSVNKMEQLLGLSGSPTHCVVSWENEVPVPGELDLHGSFWQQF